MIFCVTFFQHYVNTFFSSCQVYVVVGIAGIALTGCVLMVIILKYGRNSKFGIKGELVFLKESFLSVLTKFSCSGDKIDTNLPASLACIIRIVYVKLG